MVIATDYIKAYAEQLREFIPGPLTVLGTDGFGRSDTRENLRQHFEVSRQYIVVAASSPWPIWTLSLQTRCWRRSRRWVLMLTKPTRARLTREESEYVCHCNGS